MRILIIEEALESGKGHWPSYIGDLAGEFRVAGDEVDVLVHRDAADAVVAKVGGTRWLRRNCWVDPRSQGKFGGLLHNRSFYQDLERWLKSRPAYDRVLALTMRLQHLLAFAVLSRARWIPSETKFLLLFVQGFGVYQGPGVATSFPSGLSNRLAGMAFRMLAPAVGDSRVVLAAETLGMQDELQRFTGLPVSLFPHPVHNRSDGSGTADAGDVQSSQSLGTCLEIQRQGPTSGRSVGIESKLSPMSGSPGDSRASSFPTPSPDRCGMPSERQRAQNYREAHPAWPEAKRSLPFSSRPLTITCPGFARHEKGSDLLHDAILRLRESGQATGCRFVMQWPEPFAMPDGSMKEVDPALLNDPQVEWLNDSLNAAEYNALLDRTDLVVLPYRSDSYHHRLSRVAIEAAGKGIPLIYTRHTWTKEIADLAGGGVEIAEETVEAVAASLVRAIAEAPRLKEEAAKGKHAVKAFHSAEMFGKMLRG